MQKQSSSTTSPFRSLLRRNTPTNKLTEASTQALSTAVATGKQYVSLCENIRTIYNDTMTVFERSSQSHKSRKPGYRLGLGESVNRELRSLKHEIHSAANDSPWKERSQIPKEIESRYQRGRRNLPMKDALYLTQETIRYKALLKEVEDVLSKLVRKTPKSKEEKEILHKSFRYDYEKIQNTAQPLGHDFLARIKAETEQAVVDHHKSGPHGTEFVARIRFSKLVLPFLERRRLLVEGKLKLLRKVLELLADIALLSPEERRSIQETYGIQY